MADVVCPNQITFDISATAGLYSTLTGLLAGFAFTTLMLLLTVRMGQAPVQTTAFADANRALVGAFLALVLCSLNYAVLGGDKPSAGRAATEEVLAGFGFALSGLLVILAIVLTLDGVEETSPDASGAGAEVARFLRRILAVVITFVVMLYIHLGAQDYFRTKYGPRHPLTFLEGLSISLVALQAIVSLAYPRLKKLWTGDQRELATRRLTQRFVGLAFASAIVFGVVGGTSDVCRPGSPFLIGAVLVLTFVTTTMTTRHLARTRPT